MPAGFSGGMWQLLWIMTGLTRVRRVGLTNVRDLIISGSQRQGAV
jgi:hypothetical protein